MKKSGKGIMFFDKKYRNTIFCIYSILIYIYYDIILYVLERDVKL